MMNHNALDTINNIYNKIFILNNYTSCEYSNREEKYIFKNPLHDNIGITLHTSFINDLNAYHDLNPDIELSQIVRNFISIKHTLCITAKKINLYSI